jgi:hypothetical protein
MIDFEDFYRRFDDPITALDCGTRCAPYNEYGVPFCCDTRHAVPTAYDAEWAYLSANTQLWHVYVPDSQAHAVELRRQLPDGQVLVECLGHRHCERNFRTLVCRSFPFFPYLTREREFIGLAYYWEYEDRCWLISNLQLVSQAYRSEFLDAYEQLFREFPEERENFRQFSILMRRVFGRRMRAITLLHKNGCYYKISPHNGRLRRVLPDCLPKFSAYRIAAAMPFPDE